MLGDPGGGGASALNACGNCVGLSTIMPDLAAAVTAETIDALGDRRVSPVANAIWRYVLSFMCEFDVHFETDGVCSCSITNSLC